MSSDLCFNELVMDCYELYQQLNSLCQEDTLDEFLDRSCMRDSGKRAGKEFSSFILQGKSRNPDLLSFNLFSVSNGPRVRVRMGQLCFLSGSLLTGKLQWFGLRGIFFFIPVQTVFCESQTRSFSVHICVHICSFE